MEPVASLLLVEKFPSDDVRLDIGGKVKFPLDVERRIDEVKGRLIRNDTLVSYRGFRKENGCLVVECDIIDYATNLAMLEGLISREGLNPLTIGGVETCNDGIILGVLKKAYSRGRINSRPAGFISLTRGPAERVEAHFYEELKNETGFDPASVRDVYFSGIVYDIVHNQTGLSYELGEDFTIGEIRSRKRYARDGDEYGKIFVIEDTTDRIGRYILRARKPLPMCLGRLALHVLDSLQPSEHSNFLRSLRGKIAYIKL